MAMVMVMVMVMVTVTVTFLQPISNHKVCDRFVGGIALNFRQTLFHLLKRMNPNCQSLKLGATVGNNITAVNSVDGIPIATPRTNTIHIAITITSIVPSVVMFWPNLQNVLLKVQVLQILEPFIYNNIAFFIPKVTEMVMDLVFCSFVEPGS